MSQQPYQQRPPEQMIRSYKAGWISGSAAKKFRKDAQRLAKQGWRVASQSSEKVSILRSGITAVYVR